MTTIVAPPWEEQPTATCTDVVLRDELAGIEGSSLVGNGASNIAESVNDIRPLSYYGSGRAALLSLLTYAKSTGRPIRLTSDVSVSEVIDIDFAGAKLVMYFNGNTILSDSECIVLRSLAPESEIHDPNMRNVTTPWVITRWDSAGNWINPVLSQTNAAIGYMPTVNDHDIWSTLTSEQQNQSISPHMRIVSSDNVTLFNPKGRFALYQFDDCNYCEVQNPDIESGGKGQFGTILFNNIQTSSYGLGNKVIGGRVRYGSFSAVCFMRNKRGGVSGGFVPYRSGESGVKTYQGEVSGRSARCYNMEIDDVSPFQTVYDGIDMLSDYGDTPVERVDDLPLSSYAWHELPTAHNIKNVASVGCRGVGIWGDGSLNEYTNVRAEECVKSGIKNIGVRQFFKGVTAINCNRANTLTGEHQIAIVAGWNSISTARVIVEAATGLTNGYALYAPNSYAKDIDVSLVENSNIATVFTKGVLLSDRSSILASSGDNPRLSLMGRFGLLPNPIGYFGADVTYGAPGTESGDAVINGVEGGIPVHGVKAAGIFGGSVQLAVAKSSAASSGVTLGNNEIMFYNDSGTLRIAFKDQAGAVSILTP